MLPACVHQTTTKLLCTLALFTFECPHLKWPSPSVQDYEMIHFYTEILDLRRGKLFWLTLILREFNVSTCLQSWLYFKTSNTCPEDCFKEQVDNIISKWKNMSQYLTKKLKVRMKHGGNNSSKHVEYWTKIIWKLISVSGSTNYFCVIKNLPNWFSLFLKQLFCSTIEFYV